MQNNNNVIIIYSKIVVNMFEPENYAKSLFVLYLIIAGNYLGELFGCKTQKMFQENMSFKHILGIMTLYFFVVFSSTDEQNEGPLDNFKMSLILYVCFVITTKTNYKFIVPIMICLFLVYVLSKSEEFYKKEKDHKKLEHVKLASKIFTYIAIILTVVGFVLYTYQKRVEYSGSDWSWLTFFLGKPECNFDK